MTDEAFQLIDDLLRWGIGLLVIDGGETLCRDDLLDIVKYTSSKGLRTTIGSNGTLMERVIDMFPLYELSLAQSRLASLLIAVVCQTLVPRAKGSGRIAAIEIMLANTAVKNLIRDGKIHQLANAIRTSHNEGMISLDEALVDLYINGTITWETMMKFCK